MLWRAPSSSGTGAARSQTPWPRLMPPGTPLMTSVSERSRLPRSRWRRRAAVRAKAGCRGTGSSATAVRLTVGCAADETSARPPRRRCPTMPGPMRDLVALAVVLLPLLLFDALDSGRIARDVLPPGHRPVGHRLILDWPAERDWRFCAFPTAGLLGVTAIARGEPFA